MSLQITCWPAHASMHLAGPALGPENHHMQPLTWARTPNQTKGAATTQGGGGACATVHAVTGKNTCMVDAICCACNQSKPSNKDTGYVCAEEGELIDVLRL